MASVRTESRAVRASNVNFRSRTTRGSAKTAEVSIIPGASQQRVHARLRRDGERTKSPNRCGVPAFFSRFPALTRPRKLQSDNL
jgi:hypothetical protein